MFDNLKIRLPLDDIEPVLSHLPNPKLILDNNGQIISYHDRFRNIHIVLRNNLLTIRGSLAIFHQGHNATTLQINEVKSAIEKLSALLGVDISTGTISSIEIGENLVMDNNLLDYLRLMGEMPRMRKIEQNAGIYYVNKNRSTQLVLYDKAKDIVRRKNKLTNIPSEFLSKNLLRIEIRFHNNLGKILNRGFRVIVKDLYNEEFFQICKSKLLQMYLKINKISERINYEISTPTELKNLLISISLCDKDLVANLRKKVGIYYKNQKISKSNWQRMLQILNLKVFKPPVPEPATRTTELDEKVNYYLNSPIIKN